jgi:hypothetical protein
MAERMMREGGATPVQRIAYGFEMTTAREPNRREGEILQSSLSYYLDAFQTDSAAASKYLAQGEAPRDRSLDARELAAYTTLASMLLNLDAAVTKE